MVIIHKYICYLCFKNYYAICCYDYIALINGVRLWQIGGMIPTEIYVIFGGKCVPVPCYPP
jgi:hypothetical protein